MTPSADRALHLAACTIAAALITNPTRKPTTVFIPAADYILLGRPTHLHGLSVRLDWHRHCGYH